ncbi:MAG: enoyl-CoA hydratase family protein [Deltaproteobacteria bacterium]|nr:enoyl-CoA hydratase family protein [Deltaproteobacteria bacterium]
MIEPKSFLYREADGVATLTLNRPETLNSLTFEVYAELRDTFAALARHDPVRAVVLTGTGRGFCSGGDVHAIIAELLSRDARGLLEFTRMTCDVVRNMRLLPKPIIAAVNGTAAGAGAVLALASDLRIAVEGAKWAFLFVKVGLAGADMGAAFLLPRIVGLGRATELLMLGDTITSEEAARYGLVNKVVPAERLAAEAQALAERLARGPGLALALTKQTLNEELSTDLLSALENEARTQAFLMETRDFREAYEAFVAKRPAQFTGR